MRRSLSEYHWRSSHPGSFYERTPFVSPNVTNSDLVPRTFTERTNLIRQELVKTSFATFGATGEKWIDFCRTCAFHFNPVTRAAYQLQAHTTAEALQAAAFQAAQAALAPGLLGVNPPSTVEQTPQKSLPVDGIEVTPGGKAGAVVLTHLKRGGDSRRILSWSVDASNMQSVAPSSQVASDRLRGINQPFNEAPLQLLEGPAAHQEAHNAQLAREAGDVELAAQGGARGGFADNDVPYDYKRNRSELDSSHDLGRVPVKRVKLAQQTENPQLGDEAGAGSGGRKTDLSHKRNRLECDASDDSGHVEGKRSKK